MKTKTTKKAPGNQITSFRKAARDLGADESEATFDAALGKIARHKPKPDLNKTAKLIEKGELTKEEMDELAHALGNKND